MPAGPTAAGVEVTLDQRRVATLRGDAFPLEARITNRGPAATGPLLAHLDIASLTGNVSVDPEDWSPTPNRDVTPLAPGGSALVSWEMEAGDIGRFDVYVVLIPVGDGVGGGDPLVVSPPLRVEAAGRNALTARQALPVVIAVPLLLGALMLAARRLR